MNELLTKVEAWAATDLGLNLAVEDWLHDYNEASKKEND